jgi:hypothetical protein
MSKATAYSPRKAEVVEVSRTSDSHCRKIFRTQIPSEALDPAMTGYGEINGAVFGMAQAAHVRRRDQEWTLKPQLADLHASRRRRRDA